MKINAKNTLKNREYVKVEFDKSVVECQFIEKNDGSMVLKIKPAIKEKISLRDLVIISRQIIFFAKKNGIKKISVDWKDFENLGFKNNHQELAEIIAVNFEMANYEFTKYRTFSLKDIFFVDEIKIIAPDNISRALNIGLKKGQLIGKEVNASRELSNTPGGEMTPSFLEKKIKESIAGTGIKMKVLEVKDMKKLGMGSILGVAYGSCEKPKFIILEYNLKDKSKEKPIVLVGKAITFDTGGLNLKPAAGLTDMHLDMSGGAAVAHSIIAAAKLGIRRKIVGLIPAVENMPSGESFRPGDILKSMSGKTIEIMSTDAEGRLILADALTYAEKYKPKLVVDVATLTGASVVALGERASAIFSKNEDIIKFLQELGEKSGDYVWPMPLWDEYETEVKGINADWANLKVQGVVRTGDAINAALFLYQFAKKFNNWLHIDMAPKTTAVFDEFLAKGSAGTPIRLLVKLLESYK